MAELKIKTYDCIYRKVRAGGAVNVNELEKDVKIIPIPYDHKPVATQEMSHEWIQVIANEVINRKIGKNKRNVYISPLYEGGKVLIVPNSAEIWVKTPEKTYQKNTYKSNDCVGLRLGSKFRQQIISVYKSLEKIGDWNRVDELYFKATTPSEKTRCNVYLPKKVGKGEVTVFFDKLYEY